MNNEPFPKIPERPEEEKAIGPIQILCVHLCAIIDEVTGKLFIDALPLFGGESAKQELKSWNIGFNEGKDEQVFEDMKKMSFYSLVALGGYTLGKTLQSHLTRTTADSFKGVFETANLYNSIQPYIFDFKKTLKSKDLTPLEKFDALWNVLDIFYEESKTTLQNNAKKDPETLKKIIDDLNKMFINLDKLTACSKMLGIVPNDPSSGIVPPPLIL